MQYMLYGIVQNNADFVINDKVSNVYSKCKQINRTKNKP